MSEQCYFIATCAQRKVNQNCGKNMKCFVKQKSGAEIKHFEEAIFDSQRKYKECKCEKPNYDHSFKCMNCGGLMREFF